MVAIIVMSLTQLISAGVYALVQVNRDAPAVLYPWQFILSTTNLLPWRFTRRHSYNWRDGSQDAEGWAQGLEQSVCPLGGKRSFSQKWLLPSPLACAHFHLDSHLSAQSSGRYDPCFLLTQPWVSSCSFSGKHSCGVFKVHFAKMERENIMK